MINRKAISNGLEILLLLAAGIAGYIGFVHYDIQDMVKSKAEAPVRSELSAPRNTLKADNIVAHIEEEGLLTQWRNISLAE